MDYAGRQERALSAAAGAGLTGLLVAPGPDLEWLTGYSPPADTERLTLFVLGPEPALVVPALEKPSDVPFAVRDWTDDADPYALATGLMPPGAYGVSDSLWALHLLRLQAFGGYEFRGLSDVLPMLRAVKDPSELALLADAGASADLAYADILQRSFTGRTEIDVAADLAALLTAHGHSRVDFTIVASGPNGAHPHHQPTSRVISPGDAIVLDFGGIVAGYGSDTTRTVVVGSPSAEQVEVHDVVRRAQQAGFEAVRPGVPCSHIDRVARDVIEAAGYGQYFIHRTGHGIGVTTHEPPYLVAGSDHPLVPGMCFSIEPGIYLPGRFGVRIEDIVTVTADGARRLNNTPRDLAVVS